MMHEITTYNDEDREELLQYCQSLKHHWEVGDWCWFNGEVWLVVEPNYKSKYSVRTFLAIEQQGFQDCIFWEYPIEEGEDDINAIWLPSEKQIMDMDEWNNYFISRNNIWEMYGGIKQQEFKHRILAMLRSIQEQEA